MFFKTAVDYHLGSAYSRQTRMGQALDWSNKPNVHKRYPEAESLVLQRDLKLPKVEAHKVLTGETARAPQPLNLVSLSGLLFMSYGFTAQVDYGTDRFYYRSAPSAGALYPVELYILARDIDGLEDGLYHYSLENFALNRLRRGTPPDGFPAPSIILTGLFFRSAWKYKDRAYRYCLLDAGHVAENLSLAGKVLGVRSDFSAHFEDEKLGRYLGLDLDKERPLGVVHLGKSEIKTAAADVNQVDVLPVADMVAPNERVYDGIVQAARITSLPIQGEIKRSLDRPDGEDIMPPRPGWDDFQGLSLMGVLQQRRSRRNFKPKTLVQRDLSRALNMILTPDIGQVLHLGVVTNEIQDMTDGFYDCAPETGALRLRKGGFLSPAIGNAALSQDWVGRANLIFALSAPLARLEADYGPRSFRMAYLAAGRLGQRAYLTAEILGWGCCGIGAFFDDEIQNILGLPREEYPFYLLPLGPVKKRTHGGRPSPK